MIFTHVFIIFLIILANFTIAKRLKYFRLGYSAMPLYSDIFYSFFLTILTLILYYFQLKIIIVLFFIVLYTLLFFDIALFQTYSINLDYSALKLFFINYKDFLKATDNTFWEMIYYRKFYLYPLFTILSILSLLYDFGYSSYLIFGYLIYLIFALAKIRFNSINTILFLTFLFFLGFNYPDLSSKIDLQTVVKKDFLIVAALSLVLVIIKFIFREKDFLFFRGRSKILDFFNLNHRDFIKPKQLYHKHETISSINPKTSHVSETIAKLDNPNIIFITIESLNKVIFEEIKTKYFQENIITSNYHCVISSNTYESLHKIYNGTYYQNNQYPHLDILKEKNYDSIFFTPQKMAFEDTIGLLKNAGFETIISADGQEEAHNAWINNDIQFYNQNYKKLQSSLQSSERYFLHILNAQTHIPYHTYTKDTKNILNTQQRYKNSLQEAIDAIESLLDRLKEDKLLQNTLVIFTGDHGESFGELHYKAHSTAITKEQICVPFLIWHESFQETTEIDFSTHFDIFPTIYDLLGINPEKQYFGSSLLSYPSDGVVVYSKTKIDGLPTSFGYIDTKHKLFIDLIYERYWLTDLDDNLIKVLKEEEKQQVLWTLFIALKERGLIS